MLAIIIICKEGILISKMAIMPALNMSALKMRRILVEVPDTGSGMGDASDK